MVTYALAAKLFESFSILRWNDRLRPIELLEIDHNALKSMLTYFLGKTSEQQQKIDWRRIVDVNVMDLLSKISTSDIQSAVRDRLKNEQAFKTFIIKDWEKPSLRLDKFISNRKSVLDLLKNYIEGKKNDSAEYKILRFSHKYTTFREFKSIKKFSLTDDDITEIGHDIDKDVTDAIHTSFREEANSLRNEKPSMWLPSIIGIIARLQYQVRWSQTPRIPSTSVLGHSMYCAVLAYFLSIEAKLDDDRIVNNFYAALFHDLPEALSRDIISPVKKADKAIEELIAIIEKDLCEEKVFKQIPDKLMQHFRFITGQICPSGSYNLCSEQLEDIHGFDLDMQRDDFLKRGEFSNRIQLTNGKYIIIPWGDDNKSPYKETMDGFKRESGIDGKLLKMCDNIAAFMEARMSLQHGIRSPHLDNGISGALSACRGMRSYNLSADEFFESITF